MAVAQEQRFNADTTALATKRDEHRLAAVACGAHALHDGFTDLIYVLLPLWQKEFGLGYGELGLLRALFSGTDAHPTGKNSTGAFGPALTWNSTNRPPGFNTRKASRYTPALSAMFITTLCE